MCVPAEGSGLAFSHPLTLSYSQSPPTPSPPPQMSLALLESSHLSKLALASVILLSYDKLVHTPARLSLLENRRREIEGGRLAEGLWNWSVPSSSSSSKPVALRLSSPSDAVKWNRTLASASASTAHLLTPPTPTPHPTSKLPPPPTNPTIKTIPISIDSTTTAIPHQPQNLQPYYWHLGITSQDWLTLPLTTSHLLPSPSKSSRLLLTESDVSPSVKSGRYFGSKHNHHASSSSRRRGQPKLQPQSPLPTSSSELDHLLVTYQILDRISKTKLTEATNLVNVVVSAGSSPRHRLNNDNNVLYVDGRKAVECMVNVFAGGLEDSHEAAAAAALTSSAPKIAATSPLSDEEKKYYFPPFNPNESKDEPSETTPPEVSSDASVVDSTLSFIDNLGSGVRTAVTYVTITTYNGVVDLSSLTVNGTKYVLAGSKNVLVWTGEGVVGGGRAVVGGIVAGAGAIGGGVKTIFFGIGSIVSSKMSIVRPPSPKRKNTAMLPEKGDKNLKKTMLVYTDDAEIFRWVSGVLVNKGWNVVLRNVSDSFEGSRDASDEAGKIEGSIVCCRSDERTVCELVALRKSRKNKNALCAIVEETGSKVLIEGLIGGAGKKSGGGDEEVEIICIAKVHETLFNFVRTLIVKELEGGGGIGGIQKVIDDSVDASQL